MDFIDAEFGIETFWNSMKTGYYALLGGRNALVRNRTGNRAGELARATMSQPSREI
jgi:hypothetical protein